MRDGELEVLVETEHGTTERLGLVHAGEPVGELAVVDGGTRSATVRATRASTLLALPVSAIEPEGGLPTVSAWVNRTIVGRVRTATDALVGALKREKDDHRTNVLISTQLLDLIVMMVFLMFAMDVLQLLAVWADATALITMPILLILTGVIIYQTRRSGLSREELGLTTRNWKANIVASMPTTVAIIAVATAAKWTLIQLHPDFTDLPLFHPFDGRLAEPGFLPRAIVYATVYPLIGVPIQEFIVRSGMHAPLMHMLPLERRWEPAILISNAIFSAFHLPYSVVMAGVTFLTGLAWGYLFMKQRSLVGPIVSHMIAGWYVLFLLADAPLWLR